MVHFVFRLVLGDEFRSFIVDGHICSFSVYHALVWSYSSGFIPSSGSRPSLAGWLFSVGSVQPLSVVVIILGLWQPWRIKVNPARRP